MIKLHVQPRATVTWEQFQDKSYGRVAIALDGYVAAEPQFSEVGDCARFNFDHHSGVNRLATRSTAGQVALALKLGLKRALKTHDADVYVNDCDQDTALAVWLLKNADRIADNSEPLLNRLLWAEDLLDATGGAYPLDPTGDLMRELTWLFEPYQTARMEGVLPTLTASTMEAIISSVGDRINHYSLGRGLKIDPDLRYKQIGGGDDWKMVSEVGSSARTAMYWGGTTAFVSVTPFDREAKWRYSIGRLSPFIDFPLGYIYGALNAEDDGVDGTDRWGGSDIIGGSPRNGSFLSPERVEAIVNAVLSQRPISVNA